MPKHSATPELGSTPQFVPVAEAPPLELPLAPALAPSPAEPESLPLPICKHDESDIKSTIEHGQRIGPHTRQTASAGPSFSGYSVTFGTSRATNSATSLRHIPAFELDAQLR